LFPFKDSPPHTGIPFFFAFPDYIAACPGQNSRVLTSGPVNLPLCNAKRCGFWLPTVNGTVFLSVVCPPNFSLIYPWLFFLHHFRIPTPMEHSFSKGVSGDLFLWDEGPPPAGILPPKPGSFHQTRRFLPLENVLTEGCVSSVFLSSHNSLSRCRFARDTSDSFSEIPERFCKTSNLFWGNAFFVSIIGSIILFYRFPQTCHPLYNVIEGPP